MHLLFSAALACTIGIAQSATAAGVIYECTISQSRNQHGWIPEQMAIVVRDDGVVQIIDTHLIGTGQSPMTPRVTRNDNQRLVAQWRLIGAQAKQKARVQPYDYSARLNKSTGRVVVSARPTHMPFNFSGRGKCTEKTG